MTGAHRAWLVARREWNQRVRSPAFRISTLLSAALVVAIILVPQIYGGGVVPTRTVGLVGGNSSQTPGILQAAGRQSSITVETRAFSDEAAGQSALRSGDVDVLLVDQRALVWKAEPDDTLRAVVTSAVGVVERQQAIADLGLTPAEARQLLQPPELASSSLEPFTKERSSRIALAMIGLVLLFTAISVYGSFLLVGVVEEKSSRVVEVVLSRVRTTELLTGKIAGIGLVGLAQFTAVAVAGFVALALSNGSEVPQTTRGTIGWIVFWFVLGYAFYAVLYATAGSLVSRQEEAQSMTFPIAGIMLVGYFFAFGSAQSPDSLGALIGSFIPPTAPMVMTVRIASGGVPWWEIALSVALMLAAIYGMVRLAARIYAGAVLRIGRRVNLREAWRGGEL
jgi:ABC-2 type transport system permease protein